MSFRENLLKKIEIDRLARRVTASMGPPDSGRRLDRDLGRRLLGLAGYEKLPKRDLELYLIPGETPPPAVLVLDNDFPIYTTTPEDVAMRKSPVVKEMVKIRNIIKILNDKDVVASKKGDSVETVRLDCIATLDLTYASADIEDIAKQGSAALENGYQEGVTETLELFAELLGWARPPAPLKVAHQIIFGEMEPASAGDPAFGPLVLFDRVHTTLKLIDTRIPLQRKEKVQAARAVAAGSREADIEGPAVFAYLKTAALTRPYIPT
ncbi:MAG: hypothetical protein [Olavius algarvensis Delta 4 endosymbiont]|nr:MAG: hypothetical protein [Olavius algarvensis Delta 4 endosymbiont]